MPDTGNLRDDAIGFLRNADAARASMFTLISVQMMEYFRDTGTSLEELRDRLRTRAGRTSFETIVARAVERGEVPDVPRSARVVNLPFDLLRHDMLMTMRPVPEESIIEIVDEVWLPLLGDPARVAVRPRAGRCRTRASARPRARRRPPRYPPGCR